MQWGVGEDYIEDAASYESGMSCDLTNPEKEPKRKSVWNKKRAKGADRNHPIAEWRT